MPEIILSRELHRQGYSSNEIARMLRSGKLIRLRYGAFLDVSMGRDRADATAAQNHQQLVAATVGQCVPAVVSHQSAAALHGLPTWSAEPHRVNLTRNQVGGGVSRRWIRLHGRRIEADEITSISGLAVTSLARTVLDLACEYPMGKAVAIGDSALRLGVTTAELAEVLNRASGRHGVAAARRAIAFLDIRSESVGESLSRVLFHQRGISKPELQFKIQDPYGRIIGTTDFGWKAFNTVGEFDGRVKYQRSLRPGHDPERELFEEKKREDRIRDAGWQVVRWTYADIERPAELIARLTRGFARGRRS